MGKSKIILLGVLQLIVVIVLFLLVHMGIAWLINEVFLSMFNWFNEKHWAIKLGVIILGATGLIKFMFDFIEGVSKLIGMLFNGWFPYNKIVANISIVIMIVIWLIDCIQIWKLPNEYGFWIILEMILLCALVGSVYLALVPRDYIKEMEERQRIEEINRIFK